MKTKINGKLKDFTKLTQHGISLIVLVITIIVIVILATAVIVSISTNNPVEEANRARYESDRDNMQAVFTNTVAKIMTQNRATIILEAGELNLTTRGVKETIGQVIYTVTDAANIDNESGLIIFDKGTNTETEYYTGRKLPIYAAGDTKWYVDKEGNMSLEVAGTIYGAGEVIKSKGVNRPELPDGAVAVKWDENNQEIETTRSDANWYNYEEQTGDTTTGGTSHWANCKLEDGSYFVWIPRYAYKIDSTNKTIDVKFTKYINGTDVAYDGTSLDGYIVHPAFTNNIAAGGWDSELAGIWVAKYEAATPNSNEHTEDTVVASSVSGKNLPVFKPDRNSYVNTTIGVAYQISKDYNEGLSSHMMKNSEWGAVAYLTHSKYGRNGTEITINNSNSIITGNAGSSITAVQAAGVTNAYNTTGGVLASTTGNIYGIYDMSGGAWERTAGYINNGQQTSNGGVLITDGGAGTSTKYKTVYAYNTTSDTNADNYAVVENASRVGEAIWETKNWKSDYAHFPYSSGPFTIRGGNCYGGGNAGVFAFHNNGGTAYDSSGFRVVLVSAL